MKLLAVLTSLLVGGVGAADGVDVANEAVAGVSIRTLLLFILGSSAFTTWLSWFLSRRSYQVGVIKTEAETEKTEAEADNIVAQTYNQVLADLRLELIRERENCAIRIARVEADCQHRIDIVEEENRRKYAQVIERVSFLEQREQQATAHIKNLENKLRELGVPLPPTPWRPSRRRTHGRSDRPGSAGDPGIQDH